MGGLISQFVAWFTPVYSYARKTVCKCLFQLHCFRVGPGNFNKMLVHSHNQPASRWSIAIISKLILYQNRFQSTNIDEDTLGVAFSSARIPLLGAQAVRPRLSLEN